MLHITGSGFGLSNCGFKLVSNKFCFQHGLQQRNKWTFKIYMTPRRQTGIKFFFLLHKFLKRDFNGDHEVWLSEIQLQS